MSGRHRRGGGGPAARRDVARVRRLVPNYATEDVDVVVSRDSAIASWVVRVVRWSGRSCRECESSRGDGEKKGEESDAWIREDFEVMPDPASVAKIKIMRPPDLPLGVVRRLPRARVFLLFLKS